MENSATPKQWLKQRKTVTADAISRDIWERIAAAQTDLEKYGKSDLRQTMPALFAMYYYAAVMLMQIPEHPTGMELQKMFHENVAELCAEGLLSAQEGEEMKETFRADCRMMAKEYLAGRAKKNREAFNPFGVIVRSTAQLLELPYGDIHTILAEHLADFAVAYRVKDPLKKYPLKKQ